MLGMGDLGQELPFGHRHGLGLGVAEVQQPLEDHPPVADIAIDRQVDPAEAAVRDAALTSYWPPISPFGPRSGRKS